MICRCGNEVKKGDKLCRGCNEMPIKRGEVFWADLTGLDNLQLEIMPVVIISNDKGNMFGPTVIAFHSPILIAFLETHTTSLRGNSQLS